MARIVSLRGLGTLILVLVLAAAVYAFAAAKTVPESGATDQTFPITANDLKPPECSAISLSRVLGGSGTVDGTNQGDLILGSSGPDTIRGRQGNDCILGGGGDDDLRGDQGANDVCIGGPGTDTADNTCEFIYGVP